jgi:hypothetical protein
MKGPVLAPVFALVLAATPVRAQSIVVVPWGDQIVLTDPVVRTAQLGYLPQGTLAGLDPRTGVGWALVPGAGGRWVQLLGVPTATAAGLLAPAVDLATGIELRVLAPPLRISLVPATVLRANGNGVTVRRQGGTQSEVLPYDSVFVRWGERLLPANGGTRALARGARVLIPVTGGARGLVEVQRPARPAATGQPARPAAKRRR